MADSPDQHRADLYRTVRLIRRFEQRAIEMVRGGVIPGGIHPYIGQDAIAVGTARTKRGKRGASRVAVITVDLLGRISGLNGPQ
jgi:TPP-dependent pyruvate/acetoin dehydrogenase alpha subunit